MLGLFIFISWQAFIISARACVCIALCWRVTVCALCVGSRAQRRLREARARVTFFRWSAIQKKHRQTISDTQQRAQGTTHTLTHTHTLNTTQRAKAIRNTREDPERNNKMVRDHLRDANAKANARNKRLTETGRFKEINIYLHLMNIHQFVFHDRLSMIVCLMWNRHIKSLFCSYCDWFISYSYFVKI